MTHRQEFTEATKRQALEAAGHRCQDPLCGISVEWKELRADLAERGIAVEFEGGISLESLLVLRDIMLTLRFKFPRALKPIIRKFKLDGGALLEVDHATECADGGDNSPGNALPRCVFCHYFKTQDRANTRRRAPKKQARTFPEQLDVLKTAKVEGLRAVIDGVKNHAGMARADGQAGSQYAVKIPGRSGVDTAEANALGQLPAPFQRGPRRHYTDAQVVEAIQRKERAIHDNDGFFSA